MSEDKAPYQTSARSLLEKLGKPFPKEAVKSRQGGGNTKFDYVAGFTVIHRLNDATGGVWNWEIKSFDFRPAGTDRYGKEVSLVVVTGELTIPGLGTRAGIGVQKVTENGGEDLVKGASTDALKKAATLFGVALELYGDDYEDEDRAPARPAPRQQPQPAPTPRTASQAAPAANGSAPASEGVEAVLTHARILANDGMDVAGVWNHLLTQQSGLSDEDWKVVLAAWKGIKQGILDRMKKPAGYAG